MRKTFVLALLIAFSAASATVESISRLKQFFPDPPSEFSTAPFFVWNGEITEAMIDRELRDFSTQGVRSLIIHPRPGLITPYLSDRWFQLVRYTVDQGKKLGMKVWLYDENSYPSGFAGGHVPAQMPEAYNQGQGLVLQDKGPCKIALRKTATGFEDVTGKVEPPAAGVHCFATTQFPARAWNGGYPYVDLLYPGVTQKFIDVTMQGYEKTLGLDFGPVVPGIFTDEPNINPPGRNAIKYTPDLFDQFQKKWGYDLKTSLPSLFEETGDWRRVRHDYFSVLLDLFIERWSKPWHDYAEKKHIAWTGHYWEHEWPNPRQGPDNMAMYAWHQVPGIDMLFNQFSESVSAQFGNIRSVKELASVANQIGQRRTLSETYGGGGWELRFEDMKRLGDWQAVLGVNLMNQHLSFGTIVGARKYDYPQSFSYHTPWWKHYGLLGNYFARVSMAIAAGEEVNGIIVIEPTTSAWMYAGAKPNARMMQIGTAFQEYITRLAHDQIEFDLGSENIIRDRGSVRGKQFVVGKRAYDTVVLPPGTESLDAATARLLRDFQSAGGKLVSYVEGELLVDGRPAGLHFAKSPASLKNVEIVDAKGMLLHHRRRLQGGDLWFFVNSSLEAPASATLKMPGRSFEVLDAVTGRASVYSASTMELPPAGSLLLIAREGAANAHVQTPARQTHFVAASSPVVAKRAAPNALRIDYCDLTLNGNTQKEIYFYKAATEVFRAFGFPEGNPWNSAVQYKTALIDRNHFPAESGFEATFWFDVEAGVNTVAMQAAVERPALWRVAINGQTIAPEAGKWWLDVDFALYAIGRHVKPGRNSVTLTARPMSIHNELEPVHILGDFGVVPCDKGFRIVSEQPLTLGAWKDHNLPFYPDSVTYSAHFKLKAGAAYQVELGKWEGTVAEVRVNGKSAGVIGWQPYTVPLKGLVKEGDNFVEVIVTGSLKNLLGPHHGNNNHGMVSPFNSRNGPATMPPGEKYDQLPYGLMEPFRITAANSPSR